jgi:methionyl-tRNA formyltransferase
VAAPPLRIVVMGTGPFAVPMFETLRASPHAIVAVVTRPDHAPPGRRPPPNPMRAAAMAAGLQILDPERVNDPEAVAAIAALRPDLFVVCDYGQILSRELLAVPPLGGINLHGSLLPRHRGAAPVQWAILAGDVETGVSVIHMTPGLDAGNVITAAATPIASHETAAELERRLAELGRDPVLEAVAVLQEAVAAGRPVGVPQDPAAATRAPRITKADGIVDWTHDAARIERMRRALEPWPRATTFFERGDGVRQRLVLEDVAVVAAPAADAAAGTVLVAGGGRLVVACGDGTALEILRLVPEGRRSMSAAEFLRGSPLREAARLE